MTFEEMQSFLSKIQAEKPQTKIMNALLSCYQEVKEHEKLIIELQKKVNEIAKNWNSEIEGVKDVEVENAAALNPDISEDIIQEDDLLENTGAAVQEVNE